MVRLIQSRDVARKDCRKQHKIGSWLDFTYFGGSASLTNNLWVRHFKHLSIHLFTCLTRFEPSVGGQNLQLRRRYLFRFVTCFRLERINRMKFSLWRKTELRVPNSKVLITHSFSTLRVEMPGRLLVFSSGSHRACWLVILPLSSAASSILHSTFVCRSVYLHSGHCKRSRHSTQQTELEG